MMVRSLSLALVMLAVLGVVTHSQAAGKKAKASSGQQTQTEGVGPQVARDQPIEVSSDKLDVYQDKHQAIFTGNVIAVQGTSNMRSEKMIVYYNDSGSGAGTGAGTGKKTKGTKATPDGTPAATADATAPAASATPKSGASSQGITRIDAEGHVVYTTPTETAVGDFGVYNVETNTIDLTGPNVTLTRDQNVLKGTHVVYNLDTGRSVLTSNGAPVTGANGVTTEKSGRVHGLFMPSKASDSAAPGAAKAPAVTQPKAGQ